MSDTSDDMECLSGAYEASQDREEERNEEREIEWRQGFHVTRDNEEIELENMTTKHLKNTINFFDFLDTKPLEKELRKRKTYENTLH